MPVQIRSAYFKAVTQFHMASEKHSSDKYGEEVAHLDLAMMYMRDAKAAAKGAHGVFVDFVNRFDVVWPLPGLLRC